MIRKLTIENFFSIAEKQTFDLEIARNATDPDGRFATPISSSDQRFPKIAVIFGANASGKTNLLRGIAFLGEFVRESAQYSPDQLIPLLSFMGKTSSKGLTKLSAEIDGALFDWKERVRFEYSLEVTADGKRVSRENLRYYPKGRPRKLFERIGNEVSAGADFKLSMRDPIRGKIRDNTSVISVLAQFNHEFSSAIWRSLSATQTNVNWAGKQEMPPVTANEFYEKSPDAFERLNAEIRKMDLGIESVTLQRERDGTQAMFHHRGIDGPISYVFESHGTRRFYLAFPKLDYVLATGGLAVLDELDNDIHPLLLPEIIRQFQQQKTNPNGAQLIMSCHNATLLDHLTKEEVYFTEKDASGRTEIYGLKDVQGVRRDTNIYAKYLAGVYGAVPRVA